MNFRKIYEDLKTITKNHKFINSFGFGDIKQLTYLTQVRNNEDNPNNSPKSTVYPLMFVIPQTAQTDTRTMDYTFNILVMDIINDDYSNEIDVWSDTLQSARDIAAHFKYSSEYREDYNIEPNFSFQPFSERFDDYVSGWNLTLTIVTEDPLDDCIAPFFTENILLQENSDDLLQENEDNILI